MDNDNFNERFEERTRSLICREMRELTDIVQQIAGQTAAALASIEGRLADTYGPQDYSEIQEIGGLVNKLQTLRENLEKGSRIEGGDL